MVIRQNIQNEGVAKALDNIDKFFQGTTIGNNLEYILALLNNDLKDYIDEKIAGLTINTTEE